MGAKRDDLERRRKRRALLATWNDLALKLGGVQAKDTPENRGRAGRLLELCEDRREHFEKRAKKFLSQTWRNYRTLSSFERAWEVLEIQEETQKAVTNGEWSVGNPHSSLESLRNGHNDPRNLSVEEFREAIRKIRECVRRLEQI